MGHDPKAIQAMGSSSEHSYREREVEVVKGGGRYRGSCTQGYQFHRQRTTFAFHQGGWHRSQPVGSLAKIQSKVREEAFGALTIPRRTQPLDRPWKRVEGWKGVGGIGVWCAYRRKGLVASTLALRKCSEGSNQEQGGVVIPRGVFESAAKDTKVGALGATKMECLHVKLCPRYLPQPPYRYYVDNSNKDRPKSPPAYV